MTVPVVKLNNGVEIPQLGFGVFQVPSEEAVDVVSAALEIGYRHIDTAQMYRNEQQVGEAIARSGLARDEVFVTTKLANPHREEEDIRRSFDESLEKLGLEQVDLFLIHWPLAMARDYVQTWRVLERIYGEGRARAIGVSNFQIPHLERILNESDVVPAINQIEIHPYLVQALLVGFDAEHGIATEAWAPIAKARVLDDPVVVEIAAAVGRAPAQVVLRWQIQRGNIVFPKSVNPARMRENFEIFDFTLDEEQMVKISSLNRNERTGPDPDTFEGAPRR